MTSADQPNDNRTPPPGVEVIGELPPGVPWWDADELVFRESESINLGGMLATACVFLVCVAVIALNAWISIRAVSPVFVNREAMLSLVVIALVSAWFFREFWRSLLEQRGQVPVKVEGATLLIMDIKFVVSDLFASTQVAVARSIELKNVNATHWFYTAVRFVNTVSTKVNAE